MFIINFIKWLSHYHKWSDWGSPFYSGGVSFQRRRCKTCGKIEQRYVGLPKESEKDWDYD